MRHKLKLAFLLFCFLFFLNGCFLTKVVSVPMRLGGAVISVVPVVGNEAHDVIDEAAETVDAIPL
jgi:hypothetical protein